MWIDSTPLPPIRTKVKYPWSLPEFGSVEFSLSFASAGIPFHKLRLQVAQSLLQVLSNLHQTMGSKDAVSGSSEKIT